MCVLFKLVVDERFEQLECHFLWQTALVQLELGPDHDNRTSRIIDALSEQVLTKASLLALKRSGKRFQRAVVRTAKHTAATAVIEQSIDGLLQHSFFIANDDFRSPQLDQLFQAIVAVNDAAIEIVQIRGREPSAIQRHERTKLRRND